MENFKRISDSKIALLSEEHKVSVEAINDILFEWSRYLHMCDEYENLPDDFEGIDVAEDVAKVSVFYHCNKSKVDDFDLSLFDGVVFTPHDTKQESLKLSGPYASSLFIRYLKFIQREKQLFDIELAREILKDKHKPGKRAEVRIFKENVFIEIAYYYLRHTNIKVYAPLIKDLLSLMGIAEVKTGTVRQRVKRF